jgi:predicted metalloprotease with PDZ domain
MPGYYQMMDYAKDLENILAEDENGDHIPVKRLNDNAWSISGIRNRNFIVSYTIRSKRQFVANSYVDNDHAYIVPGNTFLYVDGLLRAPVTVNIDLKPEWDGIATGLKPVNGKTNEFIASDFDMLYDCPILVGDLEELSSFKVKGIEHRFIGYKLGSFDRSLFMDKLKKVVQSAVDIIGEIPYKQYTFIAIGPGQGGIEHLNNTTVSFNGNGLNSPQGMNRMMSFLAHEYFHHFNVKRIRPFELGPFDYDKENRTNLLWLSEGFTVYYESQILKRAGLINAETFLSHFNAELNTLENDPGRFHQSLSQASYNTWEEGPFGSHGTGPDRSISVYNKGAIFGLLLDLEIRNASNNNKSLDDVMRILYRTYYKEEKRGFTDAEFQQICEQVTGTSLTNLFEYVYTTKEIDYAKYLSHAGLLIDKDNDGSIEKPQKLAIKRMASPNPLQLAILNSWLGE